MAFNINIPKVIQQHFILWLLKIKRKIAYNKFTKLNKIWANVYTVHMQKCPFHGEEKTTTLSVYWAEKSWILHWNTQSQHPRVLEWTAQKTPPLVLMYMYRTHIRLFHKEVRHSTKSSCSFTSTFEVCSSTGSSSERRCTERRTRTTFTLSLPVVTSTYRRDAERTHPSLLTLTSSTIARR